MDQGQNFNRGDAATPPAPDAPYALEISEFALTLSVSLHRFCVSLTRLSHVPGVLCAGTRGESLAHISLPKSLPAPVIHSFARRISRPPAAHRKTGASPLLEHVASPALEGVEGRAF